ncbi:hypothetical protein AOQ84DRAFT_12612 [Glonium stellatum]|uniref:Uncharacterized protein n=1 Tax=Glonium stellatum TaxID=574774 RepID=A0A8E2EMA8_9PEZI|nr:hypothetical protein AOQ84DRAFT_12612 [Glonium stellatum]
MSNTSSSKVRPLETNPSPLASPPSYIESLDSRSASDVQPYIYREADSASTPSSPSSIESLDAADEAVWSRARHERRRLSRNDLRHLTWKYNKPEIIAIAIFFAVFISILLAIAYTVIRNYGAYESFEQCVRRGGGMTC